jgi:hypothetical protein
MKDRREVALRENRRMTDVLAERCKHDRHDGITILLTSLLTTKVGFNRNRNEYECQLKDPRGKLQMKTLRTIHQIEHKLIKIGNR